MFVNVKATGGLKVASWGGLGTGGLLLIPGKRPRTRWRGYISGPACDRHRVPPQEELGNTSGLLSPPPLQPPDKWWQIDGSHYLTKSWEDRCHFSICQRQQPATLAHHKALWEQRADNATLSKPAAGVHYETTAHAQERPRERLTLGSMTWNRVRFWKMSNCPFTSSRFTFRLNTF